MPKPFLDPVHQFRQSNRGLFLARLANEGKNLLGELVCLLGTAFVWDQAGKAILLEGRLSLVKRGSRKTEARRRIGNGLAFGPHPAQHLVIDLNQIPRIEELVLKKQLVADGFGARV